MSAGSVSHEVDSDTERVGKYQLQREVQQGLVNALVSIGASDDTNERYAVITADLRPWLRWRLDDPVDVIDVSRIAGPVPWTEGNAYRGTSGESRTDSTLAGATTARSGADEDDSWVPRMDIHLCDHPSDVSEALADLAPSTVIVDYALPWNDFQWEKTKSLRGLAPEPLQRLPQLDTAQAMLGLAASQSSVKRIVTILPRAVVEGSRYVALRQYLQSSAGLAGLVSLPDRLFSPVYSGSTTLVALGEYGVREKKRVAFLQIAGRGDLIGSRTLTWLTDFTVGMQGNPMKLGFQAEVNQADSWAMAHYHPDARAAEDQIQELGETALLGDICEVIQGRGHSREDATAGRGIPVIRGRNLSTAPATKDGLSWVKKDREIPARALVKQGDILLQRIGSSPHSLLVGAELEGALASDTVFILRPKDRRIDPALLHQYLRSMTGQRMLSSRIAVTQTAPTLTARALRLLPVPVLPPLIIRELNELQETEQDLRSRVDALEAMRLGLFDADSQADLKQRLTAMRQTAAVYDASVQQAETLDFQVRNLYPFPIAYPYRMLASLIVPQDLLAAQLRVLENVLAFLTSVSLALLRPSDRSTLRPRNGKEAPNVLRTYWQGGATLGAWNDLYKQCARMLQTYQGDDLAISLGVLGAGRKSRSFREQVDELIAMRNNVVHRAPPNTESEYRTATHDIGRLLSSVIAELSFLTAYPIRLVRSVDGIRGSTSVAVQTLSYVGDHPALPQERHTHHAALATNDLYIQTAGNQW